MGLKTTTIDFDELGKNNNLRLWLPFVLPKIKFKYGNINEYLGLCESGKRPKGGIQEYGKKEVISLGGEQINVDGSIDLSKIPHVSYDFYQRTKKGKIKDNDILICKDGALTGKSCFVDLSLLPSNKVMVNEHIFILRGNHKINHKFLFYLTRSSLFQIQVKNLAYHKKAQPGLNLDHFKEIKIPVIPKSIQDHIVTQINPLEINIVKLKTLLKQPQEIINQVFAREFIYNENLYNEFGKGMTAGTQIAKERRIRVFKTKFSTICRSNILRFSTRYHNPPTKKLMGILDNINTIKVKDILLEPIHRGATPKYDPDGNIPVVKTAHLKNGYIEISQEEFINLDKYNTSKRSRIKKGDILLASTGKVSLGKIDFMPNNIKAVADSHVSIIRINQNKYSPLFFTYFLRSILGYFQIERDYTGTTNQIELYSDDISNFLIPNIPLEEQKNIVDEIKAELDKQEDIKKQIEIERKKIDEIIENTIK
jgi:type I restriction enzyme, S subunit